MHKAVSTLQVNQGFLFESNGRCKLSAEYGVSFSNRYICCGYADLVKLVTPKPATDDWDDLLTKRRQWFVSNLYRSFILPNYVAFVVEENSLRYSTNTTEFIRRLSSPTVAKSKSINSTIKLFEFFEAIDSRNETSSAKTRSKIEALAKTLGTIGERDVIFAWLQAAVWDTSLSTRKRANVGKYEKLELDAKGSCGERDRSLDLKLVEMKAGDKGNDAIEQLKLRIALAILANALCRYSPENFANGWHLNAGATGIYFARKEIRNTQELHGCIVLLPHNTLPGILDFTVDFEFHAFE